MTECTLEVGRGQSHLFQVVLGTHAVGGFAHLLHRGHQQTHQHRDDGDHHQQFNQREAAVPHFLVSINPKRVFYLPHRTGQIQRPASH